MCFPTLRVGCIYEVNSVIISGKDVLKAIFGIENFLTINAVGLGGHTDGKKENGLKLLLPEVPRMTHRRVF